MVPLLPAQASVPTTIRVIYMRTTSWMCGKIAIIRTAPTTGSAPESVPTAVSSAIVTATACIYAMMKVA